VFQILKILEAFVELLVLFLNERVTLVMVYGKLGTVPDVTCMFMTLFLAPVESVPMDVSLMYVESESSPILVPALRFVAHELGALTDVENQSLKVPDLYVLCDTGRNVYDPVTVLDMF
jgi:hypothetical protein